MRRRLAARQSVMSEPMSIVILKELSKIIQISDKSYLRREYENDISSGMENREILVSNAWGRGEGVIVLSSMLIISI